MVMKMLLFEQTLPVLINTKISFAAYYFSISLRLAQLFINRRLMRSNFDLLSEAARSFNRICCSICNHKDYIKPIL